ncbi:unnamed protein product [Cuscuta campestris]|uniref:WIYLD domain-containing protein n=1 Tax=Cuscuta campestris TaxID=132261 RepID=A0A484MDN9_9ASTE|nr:unnamed protein product [Cuscuta campestris]
MAPDSKNRIASAFHAMKALGISDERVKPALKRLLKLNKKNWDLIEEENYTPLVAAILDNEEAKQEGNLVEQEVLHERPLKRLHLRQQEGEPSPSSLNGTSQTRHNAGGTELLGPPQSTSESHPASGEYITRPESNEGVSGPSGEARSEGNLENTTDKPSSLEIASLTTAVLKVILNCGTAFAIPNFQMPSLDALMKLMDDRCRKEYKDLDPSFSVMKVMQDVCQCFLEMGAASTNCSFINTATDG